jgi:hypothetical protein
MGKRPNHSMRSGAGVVCLLGWLFLLIQPWALAQENSLFGLGSSREPKQRPLPDRPPVKPSIPPTFDIPVEPLGFSAPGPNYMGQRNTLASLDFLDENRVLFTFRVPGLMRREDINDSDARQIRAVVVTLATGKVEAEALWTVHDRARYLWMLKDGHFLFRDQDTLQAGDASLQLKPLLQFPGPLLSLELDPTQRYMVTNSREPAAEPKNGEVPRPPTAAASVDIEGPKPTGQPELVMRILQRGSGQVMLVGRVRASIHLPINSEGYLETLRGTGTQWVLNLNHFSGGSTILARVESSCMPVLDFVSEEEVLVTACGVGGGRKLTALATNGKRLWEVQTSMDAIWPLLVMAPDGSRLLRETLALNHSMNDYSHVLDAEEVRGQLVRVFDAGSGKVALEAPASPVLDAGGNAAISPSGRRVAVVNSGAIQVFDLPPPTPLAETAVDRQGH